LPCEFYIMIFNVAFSSFRALGFCRNTSPNIDRIAGEVSVSPLPHFRQPLSAFQSSLFRRQIRDCLPRRHCSIHALGRANKIFYFELGAKCPLGRQSITQCLFLFCHTPCRTQGSLRSGKNKAAAQCARAAGS
jgi:hypothetical protein